MNKALSSRWVVAVCAIIVVVFPLAQAFRGLDLTDTGFLLTNQSWVFDDPSAVAYWFHLWLPNVLGGLVLLVGGPVGLFASKVVAAMLFWGLVWAVFRLYDDSVPAHWLWLAAIASMGFDFIGKINIVHYNNLSVLLFGWGLYFLVEGVINRRTMAFVFAGAILGLNLFVRLPNLLGLGLILVPLVLGCRLRWRDFASFALGVGLSVGLVFVVMAVLGHLQLYLASVGSLLGSGQDPESRYGLADLIRRPLKETFWAIVTGGAAGVLVGGTGWVLTRMTSGLGLLAKATLFSLLALIVGLGLIFAFPGYRTLALPLAGLGYWASAVLLFRRPGPSTRGSLALVLGSVVVFVLNWGSDTGIAVSTYAFPLVLAGLPLLAQAVPGFGDRRTGGRPGRWVLNGLAVLLGGLFVYGSTQMVTSVYRDTPWVQTGTSLEGVGPVWTSLQRAEALETMVAEVRHRARSGDAVFVIDSLPLLHYLTKTRPYLSNPWPALFTKREFRESLEAKARVGLPTLIVVALANARSSQWPLSVGGNRVHEDTVMEFIRSHGYVLVAEDRGARYFSQKQD